MAARDGEGNDVGELRADLGAGSKRSSADEVGFITGFDLQLAFVILLRSSEGLDGVILRERNAEVNNIETTGNTQQQANLSFSKRKRSREERTTR